MFYSLPKIVALLITYKYAIIFPIAVIEGPAISVIAGSLIAKGYLNIFLVFILLVLADLVGDTLYYSIGRFGGHYFIRRWNHFLKIKTEKLESLEHTFVKHGAKLLFAGKIQGLGSIVLMAAGVARYPYVPFLWYNFLATLAKTAVLFGLGYMFYDQFTTASSLISKIGIVATFIFFIVVAWYLQKNAKAV